MISGGRESNRLNSIRLKAHEIKTIQALEEYGQTPTQKILVLRRNADGQSYLEAVENNVFSRPLEWLEYRLKKLFSFLPWVDKYKLSCLHTHLRSFFSTKTVKLLSNSELKGLREGVKAINEKFGNHGHTRIAFDQLVKSALKQMARSQNSENTRVKDEEIKVTSLSKKKKKHAISKEDKTPLLPQSDSLSLSVIDTKPFLSDDLSIQAHGISNGGNRCYMNSTLKIIKSSPALQKLIRKQREAIGEEKSLRADFIRAVFELQKELTVDEGVQPKVIYQRSNSSDPSVVDRFALAFEALEKQLPKNHRFPIEEYNQQDAQEFFSRFLEYLLPQNENLSFQFVQKNDHIYQSIAVRIPTLDNAAAQTTTFMMVDIPTFKDGISSLQGIFSGYIQNEIIDLHSINLDSEHIAAFQTLNNEVFTQHEIDSGSLQIPVQSYKVIVGNEPPSVLPIQIKRFDDRQRKNKASIDIPYILHTHFQKQGAEQVESIDYVLRGVVIHSGSSITGGHYYTCVPDVSSAVFNEKLGETQCTHWYVHDDMKVYRTEYKSIAERIRADGYVMLYEPVSYTNDSSLKK